MKYEAKKETEGITHTESIFSDKALYGNKEIRNQLDKDASEADEPIGNNSDGAGGSLNATERKLPTEFRFRGSTRPKNQW